VRKVVKRKTGYHTAMAKTAKMGCTGEGLMEVDGEKGQRYTEKDQTTKGSEQGE
jgi:hypothetical protein